MKRNKTNNTFLDSHGYDGNTYNPNWLISEVLKGCGNCNSVYIYGYGGLLGKAMCDNCINNLNLLEERLALYLSTGLTHS